MGSKPESKLQDKIQKFLKSKGAWVVKFHGSPYTKKGTPDLLVCYKGRFIALEVKLPGKENNTTELQMYQIGKIREAGGLAVVVSSVEHVEKLLKFIDNQIKG